MNRESSDGESNIKFIDAEHKGLELAELLRSSQHSYAQLKELLSPPQRYLVLLTVLSDMVESIPGT